MRRIHLISLIAIFFLIVSPAQAQINAPLILILDADDVVGPPMREYILRGIDLAEQRNAEALIIRLNTPGGAIDTMSEIVEAIRASKVPVIVYVSPRGAIAGSAGTVITLAGHASAMAPETAIGAASPVTAEGQDLEQTLLTKQKEILKAQVRSLAEDRGEEAIALAEATIESAKAVSYKEAYDAKLIDFIASDVDDLIRQLDGYEVETIMGKRVLHTSGAQTQEVTQSFIEQLLAMLTNPNVVFILLSIGVQAILIEISSPGGWVAGFIGAVCLALAGYGLGVLPVNWFGILFVAIAFVLFVLDVKAPTHGALTAAGIGSFIVGALVLFNSPGVPQFQQVSIPLVVGVGIVIGVTFAIIVGFAIRAQHRAIMTGQESMIGKTGIARTVIDRDGQVQLMSELWSAELAEGSESIQKGDKVEVIEVKGLRVKVKKIS